jgi:hypothetical protein
MLIRLMLVTLMVGCATTQPSQSAPQEKKQIQPRYKAGDCLMVVDPSTGSKPTRHRVRVEKISLQLGRYYYRWLLDSGRWDTELSSGAGKFEVLEKITQKVDCPSLEVSYD